MSYKRYQFQEKIGEGGMGVIYRATDRLTGNMVALKQVLLSSKVYAGLKPETEVQQALHLTLAREFQILAGLRHPHIVSVLDYGFDENRQPYFTMAYLPDAQTILEAGQNQSLDYKLDLIQQLLQALAYLHRRGVLHCDLKPQNILVSNGRLRVLDFGLAMNAKINGNYSSGGTLPYLSPELWHQQPYTHAADLYAVGVLIYELLTGDHPFAPIDHTLLDRVLETEPDLTKLGLNEAASQLIGQLLAKKPEKRPSSARATLLALTQALGQPLLEETKTIRDSYLQAAMFIGREAEMTKLQDGLNQATKQGQCILIGGESGVGKSRLLDEFRTYALVNGWQVLSGQAITEKNTPYQLWRSLVPTLILNIDIDDLEARILKSITPDIDRLLSRDIPPPLKLDDRDGQQRLIQTLISILQRQSQPTLLLLEDLQWAQQDLIPLKQLLNVLAQLPQVMVLGTYRYDETPELSQTLSCCEHLVLERLNQSQIKQLGEAILGVRQMNPHVVSLLSQETEGNTFFIVEVMRALAEEAGNLEEIEQMSLPETVLTSGMHHLLTRRINRVSVMDQAMLQLAAVAGRRLDMPLLQYFYPKQQVEGWLHRVMDASIFTIREDQWLFAHDKLREVILDALDNKTCSLLHRQLAEALEYVYPDDPNYQLAMLLHWQEAHDAQKALPYLQPVCTKLVEITADYTQALSLLTWGLQIVPDYDPRCVSLWNLQAKVAIYQGNYQQAIQISKQSRRLASNLNDKQGVADCLANLGVSMNMQGDFELATETYQQSLQLNQELQNKSGIAKSLEHLGNLASDIGNHKQAVDYLQQSLSAYKALDDQHGAIGCLVSLSSSAIDEDDFEQAEDYLQQSLAFLSRVGDQRGIATCYLRLGICGRHQKQYEQALAYFQKSLVIRQKLGDQTGISTVLNNMARVAYLQEDYHLAIAYAEQTLAIRKAIGYKYGQVFSLLLLGFSHFKLQHVEAQEIFWQALSIAQTIGSVDLMQAAMAGFAWLYQQIGESELSAELVGLITWNDAVLWLDGLYPLLEASLGTIATPVILERGKLRDVHQVAQQLLDKFMPEVDAEMVGFA